MEKEEQLLLVSEDKMLLQRLSQSPAVQKLNADFDPRPGMGGIKIPAIYRGVIKQACISEGFPVIDSVGYRKGLPLHFNLSSDLRLRSYQLEAGASFVQGGSELGGCGVVVLPCGAGKTIVGMSAMAEIKCHTLILVTNTTAARQWRDELLDKTTLAAGDIGEYTGEVKEIRPVTIATYQILVHRKAKSSEFPHFEIFNRNAWGLIIYDEVHLLPAKVFRFTASLQSIRRLGLTATLIREDGKEKDVFSLIGPKRFDVSWKLIEKEGFIAAAKCFEMRLPMSRQLAQVYAKCDRRQRFRIVSENEDKFSLIEKLLKRHAGQSILIIGQFIEQVTGVAKRLKVPLITGKTKQLEREAIYERFRRGIDKTIVVSSVANFSIDLPDAKVAIQISGKFGSRQEEAQRLGRILRPKGEDNCAWFYSLVTAETEEEDFALKRQLFLTEQGYEYTIVDEKELDEHRIISGHRDPSWAGRGEDEMHGAFEKQPKPAKALQSLYPNPIITPRI
jgi:DNA excision repair protein ERCC-3